MKIWVVGRGCPTVYNRMWGAFELEQARLLSKGGYDVTYISVTFSFFGRKDVRGLRTFEEDGLKVITFSHLYFPGKTGIRLESFEEKRFDRVYREAEDISGVPDVIHVHYPSMLGGTAAVERYRQRGVKIVVTEHWSRVLNKRLSAFEKENLRYYVRNSDCLISVSTALLNSIKELVGSAVNSNVIPNVAAPCFFEEGDIEEGLSEKDDVFTFICVGRFAAVKQFDVIAKCFKESFKDDDKVRLKFIGTGERFGKVKKICEGDARISFAGTLEKGELSKAVKASDALVSFSRYETFAVPVIEAWACGKPVIVSGSSGVSEYADEGRGIVVPAEDSSRLCKAFQDMYRLRDNYNPKGIRKYAEDNFSSDAVRSALEEVYSKL
ncbi:MAG: glycosyltransferase [Butyrivibrio sp.]|nr:glycosyltransferase [Butyrivibrio sp.]